MTGALIFLVCTTCDIFIEYFHEPTDIVKTLSPGIDQNIKLFVFVRFQLFSVDKFLRDLFWFVEQMPSANNVFGIRVVGTIAVDVQYEMIVV